MNVSITTLRNESKWRLLVCMNKRRPPPKKKNQAERKVYFDHVPQSAFEPLYCRLRLSARIVFLLGLTIAHFARNDSNNKHTRNTLGFENQSTALAPSSPIAIMSRSLSEAATNIRITPDGKVLADCTDSEGTIVANEFDISTIVANDDGTLNYSDENAAGSTKENFQMSCSDVQLDGTILKATCKRADGVSTLRSGLDLNKFLVVDDQGSLDNRHNDNGSTVTVRGVPEARFSAPTRSSTASAGRYGASAAPVPCRPVACRPAAAAAAPASQGNCCCCCCCCSRR
jgi:hypothetical protein